MVGRGERGDGRGALPTIQVLNMTIRYFKILVRPENLPLKLCKLACQVKQMKPEIGRQT